MPCEGFMTVASPQYLHILPLTKPVKVIDANQIIIYLRMLYYNPFTALS